MPAVWPEIAALASSRSTTRDLGHEGLGRMKKSVIGDSPRRREDARFITGRGAYVDDLPFEGLTRAVFVRSPHAHARLRGIDTTAARQAPGVLAVLTATEAAAGGL